MGGPGGDCIRKEDEPVSYGLTRLAKLGVTSACAAL
jgi:hypothetical protein